MVPDRFQLPLVLRSDWRKTLAFVMADVALLSHVTSNLFGTLPGQRALGLLFLVPLLITSFVTFRRFASPSRLEVTVEGIAFRAAWTQWTRRWSQISNFQLIKGRCFGLKIAFDCNDCVKPAKWWNFNRQKQGGYSVISNDFIFPPDFVVEILNSAKTYSREQYVANKEALP
jgi:hypothetical protein